MLAVWALLNISTHHEGKVVMCRKGLYTLLRLVQQSSRQRSIAAGPDMQRVSVVAAILENLTAATENTAMVYKAELRLKHAALLKQAGIKRIHRERQPRGSLTSGPGSPSLPAAAAAAGIANTAALASKQQQQQQLNNVAAMGSHATAPPAGSAASAIMGFFENSGGNSPGRTSRLTVAANTACMVANMCTSARGPPKKLSHEDEKVRLQLLLPVCSDHLPGSQVHAIGPVCSTTQHRRWLPWCVSAWR